jgi:hypothetical protein
VQFGDFQTHPHAQRRVEVRQGLVEEERLRLAHDGPPDGDALALTARQLPGPPVEVVGEVQDFRRRLHPAFLLGGVELGHAQREGDVLAHAHVRVERVGLEHHGKAAPCGRHHGRVLPVDADLAVGHVLQPRDQPQKRGLAAARGADEDHELAVFDGQVEGRDDLHLAERLADLVERDASHGCGSLFLPYRFAA